MTNEAVPPPTCPDIDKVIATLRILMDGVDAERGHAAARAIDTMEDLRDANSQLRHAVDSMREIMEEATRWRSMETAPRDGCDREARFFMVAMDGCVYCAFPGKHDSHIWVIRAGGTSLVPASDCLGWRPRPEPPNERVQ